MHIGLAADLGGFTMKEQIVVELREEGFEVTDFGAWHHDRGDDYPDFVGKLNRRHPAYNENTSFDFMNDTGKGF